MIMSKRSLREWGSIVRLPLPGQGREYPRRRAVVHDPCVLARERSGEAISCARATSPPAPLPQGEGSCPLPSQGRGSGGEVEDTGTPTARQEPRPPQGENKDHARQTTTPSAPAALRNAWRRRCTGRSCVSPARIAIATAPEACLRLPSPGSTGRLRCSSGSGR